MASGVAHQEHFEGVTVGQPVSTDNTSFHPVDGQAQSIGTGVATGLYDTKALQIDASDGFGSIGWNGVDVFGVYGSGEQMTVTLHLRVDAVPTSTFLFMWSPFDASPLHPGPLALSVRADGTLHSDLADLESGSSALSVGQWVRVVLQASVAHVAGDVYDRQVSVELWTGEAIEDPTPENRSGRLFGAEQITGGIGPSWLVFGNNENWFATTGIITVDAVAFDAWPAPPIVNPAYMQPGFNEWNRERQRTEKVELLGEWDGTTVQPVDFLGIWDGTTIQPAPE